MLLGSISVFANDVLKALRGGSLNSGKTLEVTINTESKTNLTDLFAIGRLLAIVDALRSLDVQVRFKIESRGIERSLEYVGFVEYCSQHNIAFESARTGEEVAFIEKERIPIDKRPIWHGDKVYWRCVVPLTRFDVGQIKSDIHSKDISLETRNSNLTNEILSSISDVIVKRLSNFSFDVDELWYELTQMLHVSLKELISNTLMHSKAEEFYYAITVSREVGLEKRPHHPRGTFLNGKDKFEILLMDFGRGIIPSLREKLPSRSQSHVPSEYYQFAPWSQEFQVAKTKEEAMLSNIFSGELSIRRGRKSEGLFELAENVAWFEGALSLFTGRTELQISPMNESPNRAIVRPPQQGISPYYIPGVIVSMLLPSLQLRQQRLNPVSMRAQRQAGQKCKIEKVEETPVGFLGGLATTKIQRRAEIDACYFLQEYLGKRQLNGPDVPTFFEIDLRLSQNIDLGFTDNFLQELVKRIDTVESGRTNNFFGIVFTNVPRGIIRELQKRNCHSFLMAKDTFCLLLDETDQPHFLGLPRLSSKVYDMTDALRLIYFVGRVHAKTLVDLGVGESAAARVKEILQPNGNALFHRNSPDNDLLECYNFAGSLTDRRRKVLLGLDEVKIQGEKDDGFEPLFKLRNGHYVTWIYDFCLFWGDESKLLDCSKLLVTCHPFPIVESIVTFANNGDRLAYCIQSIAKTQVISVFDPFDQELWVKNDIVGDCVLILDALYPGDEEEGYVHDFIVKSRNSDSQFNIIRIIALCNFSSDSSTLQTDDKAIAESSFLGIETISISLPPDFVLPKEVFPPEARHRVILNHQQSVPKQLKSMESTPKNHSGIYKMVPTIFTRSELSTEFWQNVSSLGIIGFERTSRETRELLYYENNERLIQHPRTRRYVNDYVADFTRNALKLNVDVILHPTHSAGSFLAQMVSSHLPKPALTFPLTQIRYGGSIVATDADYNYFLDHIRMREESSNRRPLTCLVIDDSVLTGSSLFTMFGISERLRLQTVGALVLFNRLSPEISATVQRLGGNFGYLYRLHMSAQIDQKSPDNMLTELNKEIRSQSQSYFTEYWCDLLDSQVDGYFYSLQYDVDERLDLRVEDSYLENLSDELIDKNVMRHILGELIFHPDLNVIDLKTRTAITYNFLSILVHEPAFWNILNSMAEKSILQGEGSPANQFLRQIVFILAFSSETHLFSVYSSYQKLCLNVILRLYSSGNTANAHQLITECIMGLGILGSEELLSSCRKLLDDCLERVARSPIAGMPEMKIVAAFAWSLMAITLKKGKTLSDINLTSSIIKEMVKASTRVDKSLALIDLLEPLLHSSQNLRQVFGIEERNQIFFEGLNSDTSAQKFLMHAPGYTCTLLALLKFVGADLVLLYAKNDTDKSYFLRALESRIQRKPMASLRSEDLTEAVLPSELTLRMQGSASYYNDHPDDLRVFNRFSTSLDCKWSMGGTISRGSGMKYYVVLCFRTDSTNAAKITSYYYFLKMRNLIGRILTSIQVRFIESSTSWNIILQTLSTLHSDHPQAEDAEKITEKRRGKLRGMLNPADLGETIHNAMRMFSQSVYSLRDIVEKARAISYNFKTNIKDNCSEVEMLELFNYGLTIEGPHPAIPNVDLAAYCAYPLSVMEFVLYECMKNSLIYCRSYVKIDFEYTLDESNESLVTTIGIRNDVGSNGIARRGAKGLQACKAALRAVGGEFEYPDHHAEGVFEVRMVIPGNLVPYNLQKDLYGYL